MRLYKTCRLTDLLFSAQKAISALLLFTLISPMLFHSHYTKVMEFDLENPVTNDAVLLLFTTESDHMPCLSFISNDELVSLRNEAVYLFSQEYPNLDPFVSYLALNYFHRFISQNLMSVRSQQGKPWIPKLLVISCISLAAKIRSSDFSLRELQCDHNGGDLFFDEQSIRRMEFIVLGSLNWRMRSITPFSFLNFFIGLFELIDHSLFRTLKSQSLQILFKSQYEIKILEYKPSVVAASAILRASDELFPEKSLCFRSAISSSGYVDNVSLFRCLTVLQNQTKEADSVKRRKLNSLSYDRRSQPPQIQQCLSLNSSFLEK